MLAKSFVKPQKDLDRQDSQSATLPKITAHAISKCHRGGHCAAHPGTFNIGNSELPTKRASYPPATSAKHYSEARFHGTVCDFKVTF